MNFLEVLLGFFPKKKTHARSQRIRVGEEEKIFFSVFNPTVRFPVENLSETGIGLCVPDDIPELPVYLEGKLFLGSLELPLAVEIVREADHYLGCRILKGTQEVRNLLHDYFQTEFMAAQMKEVTAGKPRSDGGGRPRWFYAPKDYELYLLEREKNIVQFQLSFGEYFLFGKVGERLRYGKLDGAELAQKSQHKLPAISTWKEDVPEEARKTALRMVENINPLSPRDRAQLKSMLRT